MKENLMVEYLVETKVGKMESKMVEKKAGSLV